MMSKKENYGKGLIADIKYMYDEGREVLFCKRTGIKAQYYPQSATWEVGEPGEYPFEIYVSISEHGDSISMKTARPPILFAPLEYGRYIPIGMFFPPEILIDLLPELVTATSVAVWLQRHRNCPKYSDYIHTTPIDGKTH